MVIHMKLQVLHGAEMCDNRANMCYHRSKQGQLYIVSEIINNGCVLLEIIRGIHMLLQ